MPLILTGYLIMSRFNYRGTSMDRSGQYRSKGVIPDKSKFAQLEGPIDWLLKSGLIIKISIVNTPGLPLKSFCKSKFWPDP